MASSSSLIKFDQTPDQQFFLCRQCQAHIVPEKANMEPKAIVGVFENEVVNVKVAEDEEGLCRGVMKKVTEEDKKWHYTTSVHLKASCLGCQTVLGQQMIAAGTDALNKKGLYYLFLSKLILWDGTKMVYADNQEPVDESKNAASVDEKKD